MIPKSKRSSRISNQLSNLKYFPNSKRSQSETVGFVLIIIIVTIVILIFLYFAFRAKTTNATTSSDMTNLLSAFDEYTTNCSLITPPPYLTGQELIQECYSNGGEMCVDGRNVCVALNETINEAIGSTLDIGPENQYKSYRLRIIYFTKGSEKNNTWLSIDGGSFTNCTERYGGSSIISANPGSLDVRLEVCKSRNGN